VGSRLRTSSSSSSNRTTRAKGADYGQFTLYQDPYGSSIGIQVPAPGAASFTRMQECLEVSVERVRLGDSQFAHVNVLNHPHAHAVRPP
jgi:hypothetical protein